MSFNVFLHASRGLKLKQLAPYNAGSVSLVDDDGNEITMFLPVAQWWVFYTTIPKHEDFTVALEGGAYLRAPDNIDGYLRRQWLREAA